ncbi:transglycosylase family protein [Streptomyces sp. NPDC048290]|uniref:LysM peptidoglycan-binding domain-containing protein n=1 Tax=Streptomyces sp. NPDC048290 TaxID=3155811 RepID=UPI0034299274
MLSGNGRHRRPRQAPAILVAAGVTGSAIALPLLGAGGASAASGTTWDKVAECETGGAWSADEGNGRYGGLQLTQDDWAAYGGLDYASSPDQASRSQQIAVAERILADRGVGVWPVCGLVHGLAQDSDPAGVDTGVAGDPTPRATEDADGSSGVTGGLTDSSKSLPSGSSGTSGTQEPEGQYGTDDSSWGSGPSGSTDPTPGGATGTPGSTPSGTPSTTSPDSAPAATEDISGDSSASPVEQPTSSPSGAKGEESGNLGQGLGSSFLVDTSALPEADPTPGTGKHRGNSADESGTDKKATKQPNVLSGLTDATDSTGTTDSTSPSGKSSDSSANSQDDEDSRESDEPRESDELGDLGDLAELGDVGERESESRASRDAGGARQTPDQAYTVRSGDTLTSIADSLEVDGGWRQVFRLNEAALGGDPNHIVPGQTLDVGTGPAAR